MIITKFGSIYQAGNDLFFENFNIDLENEPATIEAFATALSSFIIEHSTKAGHNLAEAIEEGYKKHEFTRSAVE